MAKPRFDLLHHPLDVAVRADANHLSVALPRVSPVEDFDRDTTYPPLSHLTLRGFVEVDGVYPGEREAVVIHFIDLPCRPNPEDGTARPTGPVCGSTVHNAMAQGRTNRRPCPIAEVIALTLGVGGGSDFLNRGASERRLIAREGMKTSRQKQWKKQEKK